MGVSDGADAVVHPIVVCNHRNIAEWRALAQHRPIEPFRPVVEVAARFFIEPHERFGLDHAPRFEKAGASHHLQKR
jgi:hypothetical protein